MHKILKIVTVDDGIRFEMIQIRASGDRQVNHIATFGRGNLQFGMLMHSIRFLNEFSADEYLVDLTKDDAEMLIRKQEMFISQMTDAQATVIELVRQSLVQPE